MDHSKFFRRSHQKWCAYLRLDVLIWFLHSIFQKRALPSPCEQFPTSTPIIRDLPRMPVYSSLPCRKNLRAESLETNGQAGHNSEHHNDATPTIFQEPDQNGFPMKFYAPHVHECNNVALSFHNRPFPSCQPKSSTHPLFERVAKRNFPALLFSPLLPPVRGVTLGADGGNVDLTREPLVPASLATEGWKFE